jgi:chemotaxis protein MotA
MDLATLLGLIAGLGLVMAAILDGGSASIFLNTPSLMIVVGGTASVVTMKFPFGEIINIIRVIKKAFLTKVTAPAKVVEELVEMATLARREGVLALESVEPDDEFFRRSVGQVVDGLEISVIKRGMEQEIDKMVARHDIGISIFKMAGDVAPAFGMIGTLIGLVQMLSNMEDPAAIGPAMAVALLTTLYGALLANVVFLPIADKLHYRSDEEVFVKRLIVDGVVAIGEGDANPTVLRATLNAQLAPKDRAEA